MTIAPEADDAATSSAPPAAIAATKAFMDVLDPISTRNPSSVGPASAPAPIAYPQYSKRGRASSYVSSISSSSLVVDFQLRIVISA